MLRVALSHIVGEGSSCATACVAPMSTMEDGLGAGDGVASALVAAALGAREGLGFQLGIEETEVMGLMPC
ncbi:hypothetical protein CSQ95_10515 [Janthinobacterium sp. BJB304]|nr:hypothetical protein CSQ95_10515 [Janthinobacterium sp. BJB304]